MISKVSISNFKSIYKEDIELGRVNVFIGENGSGKSNILEAIAMAAASNDDELDKEGLINRGVRVTKPSLTFNSFLGIANRREIKIDIHEGDLLLNYILKCDNPDDIFATWKVLSSHGFVSDAQLQNHVVARTIVRKISQFLIYNLSTNALRGISADSKKEPLGINGEGLDVLLSTFTKQQLEKLRESNFISWLKDIHVDVGDKLKVNGFKLGRSISELYFTDKYMQENNDMFAAENANEGALHVLFYLALFISERTPAFFAIDNIESALNPMLCRQVTKSVAELSKTNDKQVLITTHNPAVLDGLNLHDPDQNLFVVKRTDEGYTRVDRIKLKPEVKNESLKLSELWMRGYLGALPANIF